MSQLLNGTWWQLRDRNVLPATVARLVLCALVAFLPLLISIPSQQQLVSIVYFFPMLFGVLGAITLRESVQWLRPANQMLRLSRGVTSLLADALCLIPLLVTVNGSPERWGIVAGALCAMALSMAVACIAQEYVWLAAALVGFVCLLSFDRALVLFIPLSAAVVFYLVTLLVFSLRGPLSRLS